MMSSVDFVFSVAASPRASPRGDPTGSDHRYKSSDFRSDIGHRRGELITRSCQHMPHDIPHTQGVRPTTCTVRIQYCRAEVAVAYIYGVQI